MFSIRARMDVLKAGALRFRAEERGQALAVVTVAMVALLGMCGVGVDVGRCLFLHRQLQAATDAAALAGASALGGSTAATVANQYSAVSSDLNARTSLSGATMVSGYPKVECLTTLQTAGMPCVSPAYGNAIMVKEQLSVNLIFLRVVGLKSITIGASANAAVHGGSPTPYNVAIIVDSTPSMSQTDSNCGATQIQCALNGVQVLLQTLSPCSDNTVCSFGSNGVATNPVDRVALFTFPNITVGTASIDYSCTTPIPSNSSYYYNVPPYGPVSYDPQTPWSGIPTAVAYTFPTAGAASYSPSGSGNGTYQVTPFQSDFRTSYLAPSLNQSSNLVKAAGGATSCGGMLPPNYAVNWETYYAGAIYAAQAALAAQKTSNPGTKNVLIFLSDGDANAPQQFNPYPGVTTNETVMPSPANGSGVYPSYVNECTQGIVAANAATAAGTQVYTVAYGSPTSGCSTDTSGTYAGISPCTAMSYMASAPQYFYSDYQKSGSSSYCYSPSQSVTSLSGIFQQIANSLTTARLIPDNMT